MNPKSGMTSLTIEKIHERQKFRRRVRGIAAALLPYTQDGQIAVDAFQQHLAFTHGVGLMNAVNMDTGYVNYLSIAERKNVLQWTREALGADTPFVAGAYIEGQDRDVIALYRREMDVIVKLGGTPILFQTARLHGKPAREKIATYAAACKGYQQVLAFELSPVFSPNGEMFDDETLKGIIDIPELKGMKHSSLDRIKELERLDLRDRRRPEFAIYTGNDLGINMIEYGSDYLLGLATFAPEKFAERDRLWEAGDAAYYAASDALQYLGNVAFRDPVPAYKHSAAVFLHMTGKIPSDLSHPRNPTRLPWEREILNDCARRLSLHPEVASAGETAKRGKTA
jgi:dihydrodipicolinate synthase/N-acetylneuraminate lyase